MKKIPTSVMVLSILGIIFAALAILAYFWSAIVMFVDFGPPNPLLDPLRHDTTYLVVSGIGLLIGLAATVLLIAASIASLKLRLWARKAMIVYAWWAIVQGILGTVFNFVYVFPKMMSGMPATADPAMKAGMTGGMVGGVCGLVIGMAFPICIIYFFSRPHVKDAFNGIFPEVAAPTNFPVEFPPAGGNADSDTPQQFP